MSLSFLGRRFERLLLFAAPLSLASLLTLFVVFAYQAQKEHVMALCYDQTAKVLDSKLAIVDALWDGFLKRKKTVPAEGEYFLGLEMLLLRSNLDMSCLSSVKENVKERSKQGPRALIEGLHGEALKLRSLPMKYVGVELPERADLGLLGARVSIELRLLAKVMQVVLAPLLFLWLGSLYNTRYREIRLISKASFVTEVFPHLINVYPAERFPELRRSNRFQPYVQHLVSALYAATRVGLMAMFIAPAVVSYIAGIWFLNAGLSLTMLMVVAFFVFVSAFAVLACELLPCHYGKTFPGLPLPLHPRKN